MGRKDIARDYREIVSFAARYIGRPTVECIDAYSEKRRIASYRAGRAFWDQVDAGKIYVYSSGGLLCIGGTKEAAGAPAADHVKEEFNEYLSVGRSDYVGARGAGLGVGGC